MAAEGKKVVTFGLHCEKNQEWFYTNNKIESGINKMVMHIEDLAGNVGDASEVVVRASTKCDNQLFVIEFV